MNKATNFFMTTAAVVLLGCAGKAYPPAADTVANTNVQDLAGIRGSSGETALQQRGFQWVKTRKSDDSAYTYWKNPRTRECLTVRTVEGRYASLRPSPEFDCRK